MYQSLLGAGRSFQDKSNTKPVPKQLHNSIPFDYISLVNDYNFLLSTIIIACPTDFVETACPNYPICIPGTMLCNGIDDCGDNIDESTEMCK